MSNFPTPLCHRCKKTLVEVSKQVEKVASQQSEIVTTVYRCPDDECQAAIDKKMAEAYKRRDEQKAMQQAREEANAEKKRLQKEATAEANAQAAANKIQS